jgi:hypothetical protein
MRQRNKRQIPNGAAPKPTSPKTLGETLIDSLFARRIQLTDTDNLNRALSNDYKNQYANLLLVLQNLHQAKLNGHTELASDVKEMLVAQLISFKKYKQHLIDLAEEHIQYGGQELDERLLRELYHNNQAALKLEQLAKEIPSTVSIDWSIDYAKLKDLLSQMILLFEQAGGATGGMEILEKAFAPHIS